MAGAVDQVTLGTGNVQGLRWAGGQGCWSAVGVIAVGVPAVESQQGSLNTGVSMAGYWREDVTAVHLLAVDWGD